MQKAVETKDPRQAARSAGIVESNNYLSHSIRKIEADIFKHTKKHYKIVTCYNKNSKLSTCSYFNGGCEIRLSAEYNEAPNDLLARKRVRIVLAHGLGHILFNINELTSIDALNGNKYTPEEEVFAWLFAYYLIETKSDEYKNHLDLQQYTYGEQELRSIFKALIDDKVKGTDIRNKILQPKTNKPFI